MLFFGSSWMDDDDDSPLVISSSMKEDIKNDFYNDTPIGGIKDEKAKQQLQLNKEKYMLQEGDLIELKDGMKVYAMIPEHFVYSSRRGSFNLTHNDVEIGGEFDYLAGKYVVTKTTMDGGGTGMGPNDVYPDGHHVFCVKVDDENTKIDFYQSGCFTAMIENIEPIGKAKLKWSI